MRHYRKSKVTFHDIAEHWIPNYYFTTFLGCLLKQLSGPFTSKLHTLKLPVTFSQGYLIPSQSYTFPNYYFLLILIITARSWATSKDRTWDFRTIVNNASCSPPPPSVIVLCLHWVIYLFVPDTSKFCCRLSLLCLISSPSLLCH